MQADTVNLVDLATFVHAHAQAFERGTRALDVIRLRHGTQNAASSGERSE